MSLCTPAEYLQNLRFNLREDSHPRASAASEPASSPATCILDIRCKTSGFHIRIHQRQSITVGEVLWHLQRYFHTSIDEQSREWVQLPADRQKRVQAARALRSPTDKLRRIDFLCGHTTMTGVQACRSSSQVPTWTLYTQ